MISNRALMLFNWLRSLTDLVVSCMASVQQQQQGKSAEDKEQDRKDLLKIEVFYILDSIILKILLFLSPPFDFPKNEKLPMSGGCRGHF